MPPSSSDWGQRSANRWMQLFAGVVCMVMIANLQYGWTLFVQPINERYGWGTAAIQVAFSIFVVTEAWLVPFEGWFVDRFGPRIVVMVGGLLVGLSWIVNANASSLWLLYLGAALGGIGVGCVYGTCVGNSLKWFPDRRGLAAGITAAGFGVGSAFTIIPLQNIIHSSGYQAAFLWFGLGQGLVILALAPFLRVADPREVPPAAPIAQALHHCTPMETLRSPLFWVLYLMMALVSAGGLMATAQLAPIAHEYKVAGVPVSLLGLTLPALTFALSIDRVLNGFTRPFFGWVSDRIGRESTMFIAFSLEAVGILALGHWGRDPLLFVLLGGMVFFAWGEIYSLFPSICTDCYGTRYATTNAGLLYTAKGFAGLLVPVASLLVVETGNWHLVFLAASAMNAVAAVLAIVALRPLRLRQQTRSGPLSEPVAQTG
ncbi:MAG: oxalate/formate MFS antiporter [Reyranella sp.]|nr:oxalate/formate MFS antiporter [Reyranella sp.]MBL6650918.1 oxalate/formate MFS antiporter [Reyranella sp.]